MSSRTAKWALVLAALVAATPLRAELQIDTQGSMEGELTVFKMTVTPAAAPTPALKQRLMLREIDAKQGNAAQFYYRAIMTLPDINKAIRASVGNDFDEWSSESDSSKLPQDQWRKAVEIFSGSSPLGQLREATARRHCDWAWNLESIQGPDLYSFLLPEIQESRTLSRLLALRARLAIAEGRFDDALDDLRINLKMARDIAAEPILVCALVGVAEASIGARATIDFIAAPNSPNLYWALTELPRPLIDLTPAARFEMSGVFRVLPFLRDAESQEHSPEEWARLLADGAKSIEPLDGLVGSDNVNDFTRRVGITGLALVSYTPAKRRLLAAGLDPQEVERMPVGKVIAVDAAREFREIADSMEKWWYVPYREAREHDDEIKALLKGDRFSGGYGRVMADLLLPSLNSARAAELRLQWQIDGLRTVEAIRMHAAKTGKLPNSLDEIDLVPVPENPATGGSYAYRLDGDAAVLELPFSDGLRGQAWRFEIKLAK